MARLHDLPNELLVIIAEHGDACTLHGWSLTCHLLHSIANPLLYAVGPARTATRDSHIAFFRTILQNTSLALYCKHIALRSAHLTYIYDTNDIERFDAVASEHGQQLLPGHRSSDTEYEEGAEHFCHSDIVAHVLTYALNLQSLQCHPDFFSSPSSIIKAGGVRALKKLLIWSPKGKCRTDGQIKPWSFDALMCLPCLQELEIRGGSLVINKPQRAFPAVSSFSLHDCELVDAKLAKILNICFGQPLEAFSYTYCDNGTAMSQTLLVADKLSTGALAKHAASLKRLSIKIIREHRYAQHVAVYQEQLVGGFGLTGSEVQFPALEHLTIEHISVYTQTEGFLIEPSYTTTDAVQTMRALAAASLPTTCKLNLRYHICETLKQQNCDMRLERLMMATRIAGIFDAVMSDDRPESVDEATDKAEHARDLDGDYDFVWRRLHHLNCWPPFTPSQREVLEQRWKMYGVEVAFEENEGEVAALNKDRIPEAQRISKLLPLAH